MSMSKQRDGSVSVVTAGLDTGGLDMGVLPAVTPDNYYSDEINMAYLSASQYKAFRDCEARGLAMARGLWGSEPTEAMLTGAYVDAYFSGEMDQFRAQHPAMFAHAGDHAGALKATYRHADYVIERIERDPLFWAMLCGRTQVIRTGRIGGVPFKIKIDSLLSESLCEAIVADFPEMEPYLYLANGAIVDLKVMRSIAPVWQRGNGLISFAERWGYDTQLAIYQEIERQAMERQAVGGDSLPCFIAAATKEAEPDLALLHIGREALRERLAAVAAQAPRIQSIKEGLTEPVRCERCAYCRATRVLSGARDYREDIDDMEDSENE